MNDGQPRALLPAGLGDLLPPEAAREAATVEGLLAAFAGHGYERVKPPLVEFEAELLGGDPAADPDQAFRLMDPVSRRMMAVRMDMTMQVARIATTRLVAAPRPLRLCYAGDVLRVAGTGLRPERQFCQVGVELIGAADPGAADAEVVLLAASSLAAAGVRDLAVDLTLPALVPATAAALGLDDDLAGRLRHALDRKDAAAVAAIAGEAGNDGAGLFAGLLAAAGPADAALAAIAALDLPAPARREADRLAGVVGLVRAAAPDLALTVDPVENRGFSYHAGISFTLFAAGVRGELGSGGRYIAGAGMEGREGEAATGFSLFMDSLLRAVPAAETVERTFVPADAATGAAAALRADGRITVRGLVPVADNRAEARRLGCAMLWTPDGVRPVG